MSKYTYESENKNYKTETYEWDDLWLEHTNDKDINRVLYIGDSISCGTRRIATEMSEGKYYFDGLGTSKAVDNPFFRQTVSLFAEQEKERKLVIFNNGLHGFHLSSDEYAKYYEDIVKFLISEFPETKIAIMLTNYITRKNDIEVVCERNEKALEIAKRYNMPVIDLYSVSKSNSDLISDDGIHMLEDGYKKLAAEILRRIDEIL